MKTVKNSWKWILGAGVLGLAVYLVVVFDLRAEFSQWFREDVRVWLKSNPALAPLVYVLVYVVAVVLFMPGSVITVAGGALFGPLLGLIYVSVASTTAAALAFLISRYLAADWVERNASGKIKTVKEGIEREGWRFVAFTRLVPIFPYNVLNYLFGLTNIGFWTYTGVTWLCMLPGTFAYVYAGYAAKVAAAGQGGLRQILITISVAAGLIVLASMIPRWVKRYTGGDIEEVVDDAPGS